MLVDFDYTLRKQLVKHHAGLCQVLADAPQMELSECDYEVSMAG